MTDVARPRAAVEFLEPIGTRVERIAAVSVSRM